MQKAGLGHGFIPRPCATEALQQGELIELAVVEPKADGMFYLAWRTAENGAALSRWRERLSRRGCLK